MLSLSMQLNIVQVLASIETSHPDDNSELLFDNTIVPRLLSHIFPSNTVGSVHAHSKRNKLTQMKIINLGYIEDVSLSVLFGFVLFLWTIQLIPLEFNILMTKKTGVKLNIDDFLKLWWLIDCQMTLYLVFMPIFINHYKVHFTL